MAKDFDSITASDVFDVRDVFERLDYLNDILEDATEEQAETSGLSDEWSERVKISTFLDDVRRHGGDAQYNGDWYPAFFVADSHFTDYAREFADDVGAVNRDLEWPYTCIDWEKAAQELQTDYSSINIDGADFWYR